MDGLVRTTGWCIDQAREAPARKRDKKRAEKVGACVRSAAPRAHACNGRALARARRRRDDRRRPPSAPRRARPADAPEAARASTAAEPARFPVVGIGASAGGLEALEQFLRHVPPNSGMAYVVVQHLDPTHKGMLVELLQRATAIPVRAGQGSACRSSPITSTSSRPARTCRCCTASCTSCRRRSPRGLNLPIDFFFRSLAEDQQEAQHRRDPVREWDRTAPSGFARSRRRRAPRSCRR